MTTTAHSPEHTQAPDKKSSPNRLKGPKALLLVGALSASAAILAACGTETQAKPQPVATEEVPVAEAPVEGVNNETEEEPTPTVSFEIPSGMESEAVGKFIVEDLIDGWVNASAEDALFDVSMEDDNISRSWDEILPEIAKANAEARVDQIFIEGWESKPNLAAAAKGITSANESALRWYVTTAWSDDPENIEGYKVWSEVQSVTELPDEDPTDNKRTLDIYMTDHNNNDKNKGPDHPREGGYMTITIEDQGDGTEKITDFLVR